MKTPLAAGALFCLLAGMAEAGEPVRLDAAQLDRVTAGLGITFAIGSLNSGREGLFWNHSSYDITISDDDLSIYPAIGAFVESIGDTLRSGRLVPAIGTSQTGPDPAIVRPST